MAYIILAAPGEAATAGAFGQRDFVYGTTGRDEVITILPSGDVTLDASFNSGGDSIHLPGAAENYSAELSGSRIILTNIIYGTTVSIPLGTTANVLQFDGVDNRELVVAGGAVHIGDQILADGDMLTPLESSPAQIRLGALGDQGLKILGEDGRSDAGDSVSHAGDVNGDGIADLLIGAPWNDDDGSVGAAYVVYGGADRAGTIDLDDIAAGEGGFKIVGEALGGHAGWYVSGAGDFNKDGHADLLIGAPIADKETGAAYIVFGGEAPPALIDLADIAAGEGGIKLVGEASFDRAGESLAGVGDVNGDGYADVIMGARNNGEVDWAAGAAYLLFGAADLSGTIDLADIAESGRGIKLAGETGNDIVGDSVSGAGDVNGDGIDDLIVGAPRDDEMGVNAGAAYLIFGGEEIAQYLSDAAAGKGGLKIVGETRNGHIGEVVAAAGDVNNDGFADLLVSANSYLTGETYLIYGGANLPDVIDLRSLAAEHLGIKIADGGQRVGSSLSAAGDFNDDGFADFLIGAPSGGSIAAYLIYGSEWDWG